MIAALVNAGVILDEPAWLAMARAGLRFHRAANDPRRPARPFLARRQLLFPGLASDFAAMIRAALALYEATGERALSRPRAGLAARARRPLRRSRQRRLLPHRRRRRGPVVRPHSTSTTPRPIRTRSPRRIWCGWRRSPATTLARAGRPADRGHSVGGRPICSAMWRCSTRSICGCAPPRSSLTGPEAERFAQAALKLPFLDRIVLRAPSRRRAAGGAPGAGQARGEPAERGLRLRRRALLAAGHRAGQDRRSGQRDAADVTIDAKLRRRPSRARN